MSLIIAIFGTLEKDAIEHLEIPTQSELSAALIVLESNLICNSKNCNDETE